MSNSAINDGIYMCFIPVNTILFLRTKMEIFRKVLWVFLRSGLFFDWSFSCFHVIEANRLIPIVFQIMGKKLNISEKPENVCKSVNWFMYKETELSFQLLVWIFFTVFSVSVEIANLFRIDICWNVSFKDLHVEEKLKRAFCSDVFWC